MSDAAPLAGEQPGVRIQQPLVEVFDAGGDIGRGVRAARNIAKGTLVESAQCILIPRQQYKEHARHTVLEHYLFHARSGDMLLALGLGSLFNHSSRPNLDYRVDSEHEVIRYYAARNIEPGTELTIFYGSNLWFEDTAVGRNGSPAVSSDEEDDMKMLGRLQL